MILFMTAKTFDTWIIFCRFIYSISAYDIWIWICGGVLMIFFAIALWFIIIAIPITITIIIRWWILKKLWFFWQFIFLVDCDDFVFEIVQTWLHHFLFINFFDFTTDSHKSLNVVKTFFIFINVNIWKLKPFSKNSIFENSKCSSMFFFKLLKEVINSNTFYFFRCRADLNFA